MSTGINKEKLLRLLAKHHWEKLATANAIGTDESSVRRACRKFGINTDEERQKAMGAIVPQKFKVIKPTSTAIARPGTFVIIPDAHGKEYDRNSAGAICGFIKDFKPEYIVNIGDLIDNQPLMAKVKTKYPAFDALDIKELDTDYYYANELLNQIDCSAPKNAKKIFLPGNHEFRSDILMKGSPEFKKIVDYKDRLRFSERGWDASRQYLEPFDIGKLKLFHGEFWGANHVKKHITTYRRNLMYGHTHQVCQDALASPMQDIPTWGASIGCICNKNPEWQRSKSNCWEHGFAYGWFDKTTGDFYPVVTRIIHNRFYAEGKVYVG